MNGAHDPCAEVRSLVEELTLGAGRLARQFLAAAETAKDQAEKAELSREFDRQFRSVRVGAAYLVRLDEAALRMGKEVREQGAQAAKARVAARRVAASAALNPVPYEQRMPHLDRLQALAQDLAFSDDDFAAEVTRVAAQFELTTPTSASVASARAPRAASPRSPPRPSKPAGSRWRRRPGDEAASS